MIMDRTEKIGLIVTIVGTLLNLAITIEGLINEVATFNIIIRAVNFLVCFACLLYMLPINYKL